MRKKDGGFALNNWLNMKCINKKGISALVSTVLLIGFTVVLGLIVTGWGTKLLTKNIEKGESRLGTDLDCMNADIKVTATQDSIAGKKVFVENNHLKDKKINGFISRFDTGTKIFVDYKNQAAEIEAFGAYVLDYSSVKDRNGNIDSGYNGNPVSIEVIPKIELEKGEVVDCVKKSRTYTF